MSITRARLRSRVPCFESAENPLFSVFCRLQKTSCTIARHSSVVPFLSLSSARSLNQPSFPSSVSATTTSHPLFSVLKQPKIQLSRSIMGSCMQGCTCSSAGKHMNRQNTDRFSHSRRMALSWQKTNPQIRFKLTAEAGCLPAKRPSPWGIDAGVSKLVAKKLANLSYDAFSNTLTALQYCASSNQALPSQRLLPNSDSAYEQPDRLFEPAIRH